MVKYDLHSHTIYSDGEFTVEGNVNRAISLGLDGIAISDHDNIDSWKDIDNKKFDIPVIKALELSTFTNGENVHVLGYYLNDNGDYSELDNFLKEMRENRDKRVYRIIDLLKQLDINVTYENIIKYADGSVGRPHVAKAIIEAYPERNYTIDEIFDNFIGDGKPAYVPSSNLDTKDAIDILHRNHCIAVLAHPLLIDNKKVNYKDLLNYPFDGVECFYPYKDESYQEVLDIANEKNLLVTGGSDFHGPNVRDTMGLEYNRDHYLERFLKRINQNS